MTLIPTMRAVANNSSCVAAWRQYTSAATPRLALNNTGAPGRYLADGETWTMLWGVQPPLGDVDICLDFHNVPMSGYNWDYSPAGGPDTTVSPIHVEWDSVRQVFVLTIEYAHSRKVDLAPVKSGWNALALQVTFSRTNGRVWGCWNNSAFTVSNVPTLNPYPQQAPYVQLWQGIYPKQSGLGSVVQSAVMFGHDQASCMADAPRHVAQADNIVGDGSLSTPASIDPSVLFRLVGWDAPVVTPPPPRAISKVTIAYSDGTTETRP